MNPFPDRTLEREASGTSVAEHPERSERELERNEKAETRPSKPPTTFAGKIVTTYDSETVTSLATPEGAAPRPDQHVAKVTEHFTEKRPRAVVGNTISTRWQSTRGPQSVRVEMSQAMNELEWHRVWRETFLSAEAGARSV